MVSKKVQNFDKVTDIWLAMIFSQSVVIWDSLLIIWKKNITTTDNLRWQCYDLLWSSWSEQLVQS